MCAIVMHGDCSALNGINKIIVRARARARGCVLLRIIHLQASSREIDYPVARVQASLHALCGLRSMELVPQRAAPLH